MDRLIPVHHSLSDWEFETGHTYFISTDHFVGGPSSICAPFAGPWYQYAYCYLKEALGKNIPEGMFVTYYMNENVNTYWDIYFRQQIPLVHFGDQNGYRLRMYHPTREWRLYRYIAGGSATLKTGDLNAINVDTFYLYRVRWYTYLNPQLQLVLRIELQQYLAAEWQSLGYYDDPTNQFADSDDNRVGFAVRAETDGRRQYLDNTEIWEKA